MTHANRIHDAEPALGIAKLADTALPFNRKERYFTGTVLPMLVCSHDFAYLGRLTALVGLGPVEIDPDPQKTNIQFFTEYSFVESLATQSQTRSRFSDPPTSRDTPDVVIYFAGSSSKLLAIEAKMFDSPSKAELNEQLNAQAVIVEYLGQKLGVASEHIVHVALLPQKLAAKVGELSVRTITWEMVLETFSDVGAPYFVETLRIALERYSDLVSRTQYGANAEFRLRGELIVDKYLSGQLVGCWVGRRNGLNGDELQSDITTGSWRAFTYECSSTPVDNRN